jgi:hypothetical protein
VHLDITTDRLTEAERGTSPGPEHVRSQWGVGKFGPTVLAFVAAAGRDVPRSGDLCQIVGVFCWPFSVVSVRIRMT